MITNSNVNNRVDPETNNFNTNRKFDIGKFNTAFDKNKQTQKAITKYNSEKRLNMLAHQDGERSNVSIVNLFIDIKNSWFYLIDDLLQQKFEIETFTKENRLFFIGLTLIFFATILLFFNQMNESDEHVESNKIIEKYYIYQGVQNGMYPQTVFTGPPVSTVPPISTVLTGPPVPPISTGPNTSVNFGSTAVV